MLTQILAALLSLLAALPPATDYDVLKRQAEQRYAEISMRQAHQLYEQAAPLAPTDAERRWVEMRLADTAWRAEAVSQSADTTIRDRARAALEEIIRKAGEDHDRVWAEANESLGDYWSQIQPYGQTFRPYYLAALDWWAGSQDLELARGRYWTMVVKLGNNAPREVLVNALSIVTRDEDRAEVRVRLAEQYFQEGRPESVERGFELLDLVIRQGKSTGWYDQALYGAASQLANQGAVVVVDGVAVRKPDYVKALSLYRRILAEFKEEESSYYDEAKEAIQEIEDPTVEVLVGGTLVPDSEQEIVLEWRNVKDVELAITPVDLTGDLDFGKDGSRPLGEAVRTAGRQPLRRWTFHTNDTGQHEPGLSHVRLQPALPIGAYTVTARSGAASAVQLLLITDLTIVTQVSPTDLHLFVANALTGEPVPGAQVRVWQRLQSSDSSVSKSARTDASGLATVPIVSQSYGPVVLTAAAGARQAYDMTYAYSYRNPQAEAPWRIYAFTDRPAYRPDETVHWKIIARQRADSRWRLPQAASLGYEIISPRGETVASGEAKLNAFGSFWADLPLTAAMPLGAYTVRFTTGKSPEVVGSAALFRLEEYKLPEFRVSVKTPEEGGKPKLYRLGDTVTANIEASYYFGGPVANASVEVIVQQQPYYRVWYPWHEYPWLYDTPRPYYGGTIVKRETLKTDAEGRAIVSFDTPRDSQESSYRIEARVIDASRREVTGAGEVRVMRQRYSVTVWPEHYIHRPNEKVELHFRAVDANDQPVQTTGKVTIVRRTWREGKYETEDVETTKATTDGEGEATVSFTPRTVGYYSVSWSSEDRDPNRPTAARDLVRAETSVFVARDASLDLGYHTGGLEIILDKDTFRSGTTAPVMIVTPSSGRWVLLTIYGDRVMGRQVVRLDGTAKVIQLPIDESHIPNFFITATSVFDRQLLSDTKRVVVPPAEQFLTVDVKADRAEYEPRQEGTVTVTTRDAAGRPVPAEVALSVSDESVTAIAADMAGDPRSFFYSDIRYMYLQTTASVTTQNYVRYIVGKKGQLIDERMRDREAELDDERNEGLEQPVEGGVVGGVVGGVAEAITVTASAPVSRNGAAIPPPPAAPPAPVGEKPKVAAFADALSKEAAGEPGVEVIVRSDFRSTALWRPDLVTGTDGVARATLKYPEALTTWRATARAATAGAQFGMDTTTARTKMPLIVRLQAPRFFVAGDRTVVSAVINNNTAEEVRVTPELVAEGLAVRGRADGREGAVVVPAGGEARVDWNVVAEHAGAAKLRVSGKSATRGDAMEKPFTVYEHGVDKLVARSGKLRGDEAIVRLELPRERRETDLTVQIAPSLAVTMLDALPYLIDYPYGCTEQTMSRFLPAAIVARTLTANGLDAADIEGHLFGGIEAEHAAATHPQGKKDLRRLDEIAGRSMARLYDFQHADGGWGWWKEGSSDPFMTAYVVWGFAVARGGGLSVRNDAMERAVSWLDKQLVNSKGDGHSEAWMLHAISAWRRGAPNDFERKAFDDAYAHRDRLSAYSRALLALAAHRFGDAERARVLVRNLEDGVKIDRAPDQSVLVRGSGSGAPEIMATAHWGEDRFWWRWYEGPVETTAFALQALITIDPKNELVEPVMNWLVKNRRGAQWNNTRDTAIAILALNDYLQGSGELQGDAAYELSVNGRVIAAKTIPAAQLLSAPSRFPVEEGAVRDGVNEIRIRRTGGGGRPLYFAAEARFVSLEEPVKAAGNELFVRRDYLRLAPRPTLLKGVVYEGVPLPDGGTIGSGERADVVLTIETKNDYDYLMFEDLKPAGLEAVALQSGQPLYAIELRRDAKPSEPRTTGRTAWVYQELRDRKVALFIDHLPQGIWEIRYPLRAEVPGSFHALPLLGQAMYVPEVRANGDEVRLTVK